MWFFTLLIRFPSIPTGRELDPTIGGRIACIFNNGTAKVLSTATGEELLALRDDGKALLFCCAFSPTDLERRQVLTGGWKYDSSGTAILWDSLTGAKLVTYRGHTSEVLFMLSARLL